MQSRCGGGVAARPRQPGARSGLPSPVPACGRRGRRGHLAGAGSCSHCGVDWADLIGVFGREEEGGGVRSGPGEPRTILLLHFISVRPRALTAFCAPGVCVLLLQDLLQSCARGGRRRVEDMCYERRRGTLRNPVL